MQARMRQILHFAAVAVCLVVVFGGTALAQSNPNLGTWKLNVAKSQFDPGPPPTSQTSVIEAWETDGVKITTTVVLADGKTRAGDTSYHYDGKDYKTLGGRGTFAAKRVDANTVAMMFK